jgi:hypothetical protein
MTEDDTVSALTAFPIHDGDHGSNHGVPSGRPQGRDSSHERERRPEHDAALRRKRQQGAGGRPDRNQAGDLLDTWGWSPAHRRTQQGPASTIGVHRYVVPLHQAGWGQLFVQFRQDPQLADPPQQSQYRIRTQVLSPGSLQHFDQ